MICNRLFDRGHLFTTISDGQYPGIKAEILRLPNSKLYTLDLSQAVDENSLYELLLHAFEVSIPSPGLKHASDACLEAIEDMLVQRPERSVILAVTNVTHLLGDQLQLFLVLMDFLSWLAMSLLHYPKTVSTPPVLLRVVFLGNGPNYPDRPDRLYD